MKDRILAIGMIVVLSVSLLFSLSPIVGGNTPMALAAPGREAPKVIAVEPNEAPNDLDITVVISGEGFEETPTVYLGETELTEVTWVSETELEAVMPWGMDPGVYALMVENPAGETSTLADAFTVTQGLGVWTSGGPYGGFVESLVLGDEAGEIIYALVKGVGVFRSKDGGDNWELIFINIGHENRLEIDPMNPNHLYIATGVPGKAAELYHSDDGGDSWIAMPEPVPGNIVIYFFAFINPHNGHLFGTLSGDVSGTLCDWGCCLFRFDETDQNWVCLVEDGPIGEVKAVSAIAFDPKDSQMMYAGQLDGAVIQSNDGGETWTHHSQTPMDFIKQLVVNPVGGELWACGPGGLKPGGLYRYDGENWISMYTSPYQFTKVSNIIFDPNAVNVQSQHIWIAADGVLKSEDGGETWEIISDLDIGVSLALNPSSPQTIYSSGLDGVAKTINGGVSWLPVNEGMTGVIPSYMSVNPLNPTIVYGCSGPLYGTQTGGNSWQKLEVGGCGPIIIDPDNPNHVIVATHIADDGWNFTRDFTIPMPPEMDEHRYQRLINAIVARPTIDARPGLWLMGVGLLDNENPYFNYDGGGGIYLSDDGENWDLIKYDLDCPPTSFGFDPVDDNILYATTSGRRGGINCGEEKFLRSKDGGQTWLEVAESFPELAYEGKIAVEPTPPYRIFSFPFVSMDQGESWNAVSRPTGGHINELLYLEGSPSVLYAATLEGLYRSLDGAQTWQRAQGVLGQFEIWSLAGVATEDGRHIVYAATIGGVEEVNEFTSSGLRESSDALVNAGVYRLTTVFPPLIKIYLPLIGR